MSLSLIAAQTRGSNQAYRASLHPPSSCSIVLVVEPAWDSGSELASVSRSSPLGACSTLYQAKVCLAWDWPGFPTRRKTYTRSSLFWTGICNETGQGAFRSLPVRFRFAFAKADLVTCPEYHAFTCSQASNVLLFLVPKESSGVGAYISQCGLRKVDAGLRHKNSRLKKRRGELPKMCFLGYFVTYS